MAHRYNIGKWPGRFFHAFQNACPVILFFVCTFLMVVSVFGVQYAMMVSVITVFFQGRYKRKNNTIFKYIRLLLLGSFLILLAYATSLHLALLVSLNLCVPFLLVFLRSSQFNPKGYFAYAMLFVFLSLMPPENPEGLWEELVVFWCCVVFLAVFIGVCARFSAGSADASLSLKKGLLELAELLELVGKPERKKELQTRFDALLHAFTQTSYHQNIFSVKTRENQIYDMMATLIQRFSYLITDYQGEEETREADQRLLKELSDYLRETVVSIESGGAPAPETGASGKMSGNSEEAHIQRQIARAQELLDHMTLPQGRVRIFGRSLLHMMILLLKTRSLPVKRRYIRGINWKELWQQLRFRLTPESFEMRFAMRLSMAMTISCIISYFLPITHAHWIPLNAFLLLQPSYEDSNYRMKTRPIGTLIGCVAEFFLYPFLPDTGMRLLFALVMISLMYCATPGTWYHPIFSTCYALTLATMTLNETAAIALRLGYLAAAVVIVFAVNRFFFPVRREAMFRYNFKALFKLHNNYWEIIRKGLFADTDLSISCEILTYFHMLYEECVKYLRQRPDAPSAKEQRVVLLTLWHMFSELEQLHYLVRVKGIRPGEFEAMQRLVDSIQKELYPIIDEKDFSALKSEAGYQDPEAAYVLGEYLKHAEFLLKYRKYIPF